MKNFWEGAGNKFAQLRQTAAKQASFLARPEDHLSISEIDVAALDPEEAVSKLAAQNGALVGHVRKLQGVNEANHELKQEVAFLQGEQKSLETQLAERTQQIRSLQASHKASLQQLQEACEGMRGELTMARKAARANAGLRAECDQLRFRLIMQGAETESTPADTRAEWERLKCDLTERLEAAEARAEAGGRAEQSSDGDGGGGGDHRDEAQTALQKDLDDAMAALKQSQARVAELESETQARAAEIADLQRLSSSKAAVDDASGAAVDQGTAPNGNAAGHPAASANALEEANSAHATDADDKRDQAASGWGQDDWDGVEGWDDDLQLDAAGETARAAAAQTADTGTDAAERAQADQSDADGTTQGVTSLEENDALKLAEERMAALVAELEKVSAAVSELQRERASTVARLESDAFGLAAERDASAQAAELSAAQLLEARSANDEMRGTLEEFERLHAAVTEALQAASSFMGAAPSARMEHHYVDGLASVQRSLVGLRVQGSVAGVADHGRDALLEAACEMLAALRSACIAADQSTVGTHTPEDGHSRAQTPDGLSLPSSVVPSPFKPATIATRHSELTPPRQERVTCNPLYNDEVQSAARRVSQRDSSDGAFDASSVSAMTENPVFETAADAAVGGVPEPRVNGLLEGLQVDALQSVYAMLYDLHKRMSLTASAEAHATLISPAQLHDDNDKLGAGIAEAQAAILAAATSASSAPDGVVNHASSGTRAQDVEVPGGVAVFDSAPNSATGSVCAPVTPAAHLGGLRKTFASLVAAHEAVLEHLTDRNGGSVDEELQRAMAELKAKAAEASREVALLSDVTSQQEEELALQWAEKQALQSEAQGMLASAQQDIEMLREQVAEAHAAMDAANAARAELTNELMVMVQRFHDVVGSATAPVGLPTVEEGGEGLNADTTSGVSGVTAEASVGMALESARPTGLLTPVDSALEAAGTDERGGSELEGVRSALNGAVSRTASLEAHVAQMQTRLAAAETACAAAEERAAAAEAAASEARASADALEEARGALQACAEAGESTASGLQAQLTAMEARARTAEEACAVVKGAAAALRVEQANAEKCARDATAKVEELNAKLLQAESAKQDAVREAQAEVAAGAEAAEAAAREAAQAAASHASALEAEVDRLQDAVATLTQELTQAREASSPTAKQIDSVEGVDSLSAIEDASGHGVRDGPREAAETTTEQGKLTADGSPGAAKESRSDTAQRELSVAMARVAELEAAAHEASQRAEALVRDLATAQEALASEQVELERAKSNASALYDRVTELETELDARRQAVTAAEAHVAELSRQEQDRGAELTSSSERVLALNGTIEGLQQQLMAAQESATAAEAHGEEAAAAAAAARARTEETEAELRSAQEALASATAQLEAAGASTSEALVVANDRCTRAEEALGAEQARTAELESELAASRDRVQALSDQVTALERRVAAADSELQDSSAAMQDLTSRVEQGQARVEELEKELAAARERSEEAAAQHASELEAATTAASQSLRQGTQELQQALKNVQAQLQIAHSEHASAQSTAKTELEDARAQIAVLEKARAEVEARAAQLQSASEAAAAQAAQAAQAAAAHATQGLDAIRMERDALQGRLDRLQALNKEKTKEIEKLQAQYSAAKSAMATAEANAERLGKESAALKQQLESLNASYRAAKAESALLATVRSRLAKLKGFTSGVEGDKITAMVDEVAKSVACVRTLEQDVEKSKAAAGQAAEAKAEAARWSKQASAESAAVSRLRQELATAIGDTAAARDDLAAARAELSRVQLQAKRDRQRAEASYASAQEAFADLRRQSADAWPDAVRDIVAREVESAVRQATSALESAAARDSDAHSEARAMLEAELEAAQARAEDAEARVEAMAARVNVLGGEVRGQEGALMSRVQAAERVAEAARAQASAAEDDVASAEDRVSRAQDAVHAERQRAEALDSALKSERASKRELLAERDEEIAHLRQQLAAKAVPPLHETYVANDGTARAAASSSSDSGAGALQLSDYWKRTATEAQARVEELEAALSVARADVADEQKAHELRDLADSARRAEIQELQASAGRSGIDIEYLKNVLIGFFESGELPSKPQVLMVLERLLLFTERDKERVSRAGKVQATRRQSSRSGQNPAAAPSSSGIATLWATASR